MMGLDRNGELVDYYCAHHDRILDFSLHFLQFLLWEELFNKKAIFELKIK